MFKLNTRLLYATVFFILIVMLIYTSKPSLVFDTNGNIRAFGIGDDKTMFSFGVFTIVLAILSFYFFCVIDVIFKSDNNIIYS
jgi:hypothetical protein